MSKGVRGIGGGGTTRVPLAPGDPSQLPKEFISTTAEQYCHSLPLRRNLLSACWNRSPQQRKVLSESILH